MESKVTEGEGAVYFVVSCGRLTGPMTYKEAEPWAILGPVFGKETRVIRGVDVSEEFGV